MSTIEAILRLRQVIRRQHKSLSTESAYVYWLSRYMDALDQIPEHLPSERKGEAFLSQLARYRDISASTQNQALNALVYFYREVLRQPIHDVDALRARRPIPMRRAPTLAETRVLLQTIRDEAGY